MSGLVVVSLLTVVVYNTAAVRDETLVAAKAEVERILAEANVAVSWTSQIDAGTFGVHVVVRRKPGEGPGAGIRSALGTTVGDGHSHGGSCFVFYERVLEFAHQHQRPVAVVLAYAVAHELGHVLLPRPAHSPTGLMKGEWNEDDMRHFAAGAALFTPTQVMLMNAAIDGHLAAR